MANKTITELPSATTPLDGTEEFAMWQGGATVKGTRAYSANPKVVNLRDYGVTTATTDSFNTAAIADALTDAGTGGIVEVPNYGGGANVIEHEGITLASYQSIRGEGFSRPNYRQNAQDTILSCTDSGVANITIASSAKGWSVQGVTLSGGEHGIEINGGAVYSFGVERVNFSGFQTSAIYITNAAILDARFSDIYMVGNNSDTHGIYIDGESAEVYLQSVLFEHLWAYQIGGIGFLCDAPRQSALQPTFQDMHVRWMRVNNAQYASVALRGSFHSCEFEEVTTEGACAALASNARCDFILDSVQYSAPASMNVTNMRFIRCSPESTGYIPFIARGGTPLIVDNGLTGFSGSYGVRYSDKGTFGIDGIGYSGSYPSDPGYTVYGSSTASTMPVFPSI